MPTHIREKKTKNGEKRDKEDKRRERLRSIKKVGTQEIIEVEKDVWKERVRTDASAKGLKSCHRVKGGVHAKKEESVFTIERKKRGDINIYGKSHPQESFVNICSNSCIVIL